MQQNLTVINLCALYFEYEIEVAENYTKIILNKIHLWFLS